MDLKTRVLKAMDLKTRDLKTMDLKPSAPLPSASAQIMELERLRHPHCAQVKIKTRS